MTCAFACTVPNCRIFCRAESVTLHGIRRREASGSPCLIVALDDFRSWANCTRCTLLHDAQRTGIGKRMGRHRAAPEGFFPPPTPW